MVYITELRKIDGVGHRPLQMVTCGVFLFDEQDRVLLEQRSDDDNRCVLGGSMELGENTAKERSLGEKGYCDDLTMIAYCH